VPPVLDLHDETFTRDGVDILSDIRWRVMPGEHWVVLGANGAGKTTLLNRILNGSHGLRIGVLVNDFGAINIDAELVAGVEENMINLTNGCVCCEIRDDLIQSVAELLERDDPIEHIILEASGVADPAGIFMTFMDSRVHGTIRLDSVTCVVDSEQAFDPDEPEFFDLQLRQIGFSDLVILNKIDLAGVEGASRVKHVIDRHFARVRLVPAINCEVPLEILVSVGRFDHASALLKAESRRDQPHDHVHHDHDHGSFFNTWSYESDEPLDRKALQDMIKRRLPANIYRCKGFVYAAADPERRYLLQVVGRRVELKPDRDWGDATPLNRIVAIAHQATLDSVELTKMFDDCHLQAQAKSLIA